MAGQQGQPKYGFGKHDPRGVWELDFPPSCMCGSHDIAFPWVESQLPSLLPCL